MGAIATQALANPRYGPDGLALLREGLSADEVVEKLGRVRERAGQSVSARILRGGQEHDVTLVIGER